MDDRSTPPARLSLTGPDAPDISVLMAVIRRLTICSSVQEIMETVTPAARTLLAADGITFVLRDGGECFYAEEDAVSPLWKGRRFPIDACISGWCMVHRRAAVIPDVYRDPRIPHDAYRPTFVRSLAMVPVRQDDPVAAMGAYWRTPRQIAPYAVELLQTIANAAGLALANITLDAEREQAGRARLELGHRIRNVLSVVAALAHQTLRTTPEPAAFREAFQDQLQALARAQTVLEATGEAGAGIRSLIEDQVMLRDGAERIVCRGPDQALAADEAMDLALVLHELGTNARKYGALSADGGTVTVDWRVEPEAGGDAVALTWTERGGPPVSPPASGGAGSVLLRSAFRKRGGGLELRFPPEGVECRMRIPLRPTPAGS